MLIAPTVTGLRSRNGVLMADHLRAGRNQAASGSPRRCVPGERSGGGSERRGVISSEITPVGTGLVVDRDALVAGQLDLAGERAQVEVEPRAVDRGTADLVEPDRQDLGGPA